MKEQLHTIPLNDAFLSGDECPFCFLERQAEQRALRYTAGPGASYMEPDVRELTNRTGFCGPHLKKLYDYGNTLGVSLMLQTRLDRILENFEQEAEHFARPPKKSLFSRKPQQQAEPWWQRLEESTRSCFICHKVQYNMDRYYATFFALLKEPEFRARVENSKGFCLRHFSQLLCHAEQDLPNAQRDWFYDTVIPLTLENLKRVKADLDWLIAKYDYRNSSAPWGNSQDALQRTIQKLSGGHPADKPYKNE